MVAPTAIRNGPVRLFTGAIRRLYIFIGCRSFHSKPKFCKSITANCKLITAKSVLWNDCQPFLFQCREYFHLISLCWYQFRLLWDGRLVQLPATFNFNKYLRTLRFSQTNRRPDPTVRTVRTSMFWVIFRAGLGTVTIIVIMTLLTFWTRFDITQVRFFCLLRRCS